MALFEQLALGVLVVYALASLCGFAGLVGRVAWLRRAACFAAVGGFALQTFAFMLGSHAALPGGLSLGAYLQLLAWFLLLCGILGWWKLRLEEPLLFAAPPAFLLAAIACPFLHRQLVLPTQLSGYFYALHIGTLFLSLAMIALALGAGLLFLYMHRKIKAKERLVGFQRDFPALFMLDKINALCVAAGFPLYTIGIGSGFVWSGIVWGANFSGDPKEIISLFTWLGFAVLFHQRLLRGWQGRKPALFAIGLFTLCVFSIVVVNIFLPTHHAFVPLNAPQ
ncbi:MAG: cytochrome c biogenesis protein CcsA [Deltaproteobacteria bacterium]|jgi:ABC-type transport system involved in cytochrome c biogenesis permease subunit|nr:cytochrome c biogenesis protein CcsA [Deltaproteobacteria bacterium]